tara:strand:+ start:540 stop:944 length:405 start_codon:yes stop_codon:yes gene_type:complete
MENTNGIFFSLNEIDDNNISDILQKIDQLMETASDKTLYPSSSKQKDYMNNKMENEDNDKDKDDVKSDLTSNKSFDCDKAMIKDIESHMNKTNKKSIHVKYSIAKKKYNKQIQADTKKIENTDLSELTEDKYIY